MVRKKKSCYSRMSLKKLNELRDTLQKEAAALYNQHQKVRYELGAVELSLEEKQKRQTQREVLDFRKSKHSFTMYKKVIVKDKSGHWHPAIATLEVPKGALRTCGNDYKYYTNPCGMEKFKIRVSEAKVISIIGTRLDRRTNKLVLNKKARYKKARSGWDRNFTYSVRKIARPDKFNKTPSRTCTGGIHGFLGLEAALSYHL